MRHDGAMRGATMSEHHRRLLPRIEGDCGVVAPYRGTSLGPARATTAHAAAHCDRCGVVMSVAHCSDNSHALPPPPTLLSLTIQRRGVSLAVDLFAHTGIPDFAVVLLQLEDDGVFAARLSRERVARGVSEGHVGGCGGVTGLGGIGAAGRQGPSSRVLGRSLVECGVAGVEMSMGTNGELVENALLD